MDSAVSNGRAIERRQQPRHHQVIRRVGRQGAKRINLLCHPHRAQLGGHGRADPATTINAVRTGPSSLLIDTLTTARVAVSILTL